MSDEEIGESDITFKDPEIQAIWTDSKFHREVTKRGGPTSEAENSKGPDGKVKGHSVFEVPSWEEDEHEENQSPVGGVQKATATSKKNIKSKRSSDEKGMVSKLGSGNGVAKSAIKGRGSKPDPYQAARKAAAEERERQQAAAEAEKEKREAAQEARSAYFRKRKEVSLTLLRRCGHCDCSLVLFLLCRTPLLPDFHLPSMMSLGSVTDGRTGKARQAATRGSSLPVLHTHQRAPLPASAWPVSHNPVAEVRGDGRARGGEGVCRGGRPPPTPRRAALRRSAPSTCAAPAGASRCSRT